MAKVKPASFINSIHGRIGNIIFYNVNGSQYARSYTIPANPRTEEQQNNRMRFADAVKLWQQLSDEEKSVFNTRAEGTPLSGYNLFISVTLKGITQETETSAERIYIAVKLPPAILQRADTSVIAGLYIPLSFNNHQLTVKSLKIPPGEPAKAA
ncbi:MAG: hypothetical protein CVV49_17340 [Spirochaetae bacterium HGW-Spirochaetae-5]|nr:MAG: hypothetical protein CVV49_17340 [Spirochaetae bacterium HGW-Spirochaetae-5]